MRRISRLSGLGRWGAAELRQQRWGKRAWLRVVLCEYRQSRSGREKRDDRGGEIPHAHLMSEAPRAVIVVVVRFLGRRLTRRGVDQLDAICRTDLDRFACGRRGYGRQVICDAGQERGEQAKERQPRRGLPSSPLLELKPDNPAH